MAFSPRTSTDVLKTLAGRVIQRSSLSDLVEGSVLTHILASIADEIVSYELRLSSLRDSFHFTNTTGNYLDIRCAELPPRGIARNAASVASGSVMQITREDLDETGDNPYPADLAIPAGTEFENPDTGVAYITVGDNTIPAGAPSLDGVYIVSVTPGTAANAGLGEITEKTVGPEEIIAVTNTLPLANATNLESDGHLRMRVAKYLSSLARCQPKALEYAALTFRSSSGQVAKWATVYEDPIRPGYSEIIIDDGSALVDLQRDGGKSTGVVSSTGVFAMYFERPATKNIDKVVIVTPPGQPAKASLTEAGKDYVSIPERGVLYLTKQGQEKLSPGDTWVIENQNDGTPYRVYTDLVAELQGYLEGSVSDPTGRPGLRASGTRVRVKTPTLDKFAVDIWFAPVTGVAHEDLKGLVVTSVVQFCQQLAPGQSLIVAQLIDYLMNEGRLQNIRLYKPGTFTPLEDVEVQNYWFALRATSGDINIVASPEGD